MINQQKSNSCDKTTCSKSDPQCGMNDSSKNFDNPQKDNMQRGPKFIGYNKDKPLTSSMQGAGASMTSSMQGAGANMTDNHMNSAEPAEKRF
jgi:hypothetical protein